MSNKANNTAITERLKTLAEHVGIILSDTQLNIGGERAFLSPHKFVLSGTYATSGKEAILKCATHPEGVAEITQEHNIMQALRILPFASEELIAPTETYYGTTDGYTVSITDFIEQPKVFTDFSLKEQFFMAVHALECQEAFHATTHEHQTWVRDLFTHHTPDFYISDFKKMASSIAKIYPTNTDILNAGYAFLSTHQNVLEVFDRYVIHSDLVPHNFRINNRQIHLLDFVSFRIGNKYEGWARLINFMEIHSPALVPLLLQYVRADRGETEYLTLRLMRVYKICFLLNYHAGVYKGATGDLELLAKARLTFWTQILDSVLHDQPVDEAALNTYYEKRATLRTPEEKERQRQFTWTN